MNSATLNDVATRAAQASPANNGILYNGGPVMNNPHGTNVYYIGYGTWDASSKDILTYFANQIGGSPYFNINTTYYDYDKEGGRRIAAVSQLGCLKYRRSCGVLS